jgi:flagellar biosynthesis/type III secretory pathway protein FliH
MASAGARNASLAALTPDAIRAIVAEELQKNNDVVGTAVAQIMKDLVKGTQARKS